MKATKKTLTWPIFIISLPDCTDRRAPLVSDLREAGLEFEIFPAVDARQGVPAEFEQMIDRDGATLALHRKMSDAEFGCALSHQLIYQKVVGMGLPGAVILEDDARLTPEAARAISTGFFEKYNFTQFNYGFARIPRFAVTSKEETEEISTIRLLCNSGLASGYAVSRKACEFISRHSIPLKLPADWPCDLRRLNPRITVPRLVSAPQEVLTQSTLMADRDRSRKEGCLASELEPEGNLIKKKKNPQSVFLKNFGWIYAKTLTRKKRKSVLSRLLNHNTSRVRNKK